MQRVAVIGPVASGKTTLAHFLAQRVGLPHTELDILKFAPGWSQVPDSEFRGRVADLVQRERWVIDGNYASVRDLLWRRADTVVWLDYSLSVVLGRLISRTVKRIVAREDLGSGRRERVGRLFTRKSIIWWAITSHRPLRAEYERATAIYSPGTAVIRLRSPRAASRWLTTV